MVKKNVLTPVLAGVLGVTVAGSGVLYVLDNKDGNKSSDKGSDTETAVKAKAGETAFARVQDKVEATAEKVEKAFKGELDFAYNGKAEITFGPAVTKEFGTEIKPITIEAKTRQKGGMSEADVSAAYDSKVLATLNFIADSNNNKIYIKVPELSGAYLTATEEEFKKLLDKSGDLQGAFTSYRMASSNPTALTSSGLQTPDMNKLKEAIDQIDLDALLKDFEEYADVIKDKIPEGKDNGKVEGDINGNSYSYTVKTVEVTGKVVSDIASAVADKLKTDDTMKDTFSQMGMNAEQYTQMMNSLAQSLAGSKDAVENQDKVLFTVDVFYNGDDPSGFKLDVGGKSTIKMVSINTKDVLGIDLSAVTNGKEAVSVKGAFKSENETVNGDLTVKANVAGNNSNEIKLSVKDLKEAGDLFSGTVDLDITSNKGKTGLSLTSASTDNKLDVTFKMTQDSQEGFTVKLTGEKTDATDVSVPTGDSFNLDEDGLKKYIETIDKDKFEKTVKDALGEELWNKLHNNTKNNNNWD